MARSKDFTRQLDALFQRRTHWLRHVIARPGSGRPPAFMRAHRETAIARLQELASQALADRLGRRVFREGVRQRRSWRVLASKGRGPREKKEAFDEWFEARIGHKNCLYVFWRGRRCIYVGRTARGGKRASSHFEKFWFQGVTRVDVYATRGKSSLPAMECVAQHRFNPKQNRVKAAAARWTKKCPLCAIHRDIRSELRGVFRLN